LQSCEAQNNFEIDWKIAKKEKTMKTTQLIAALLFVQSYEITAKLSTRSLAPEEFGDVHNRICLQVRDRIAEKTPNSRGEAFRYLTEELLNLCEEDDGSCHSKIRRAALKSQSQNYQYRDYETIIDDVMPFTLEDMEVRNTLKDIYYSIDLLDTMSVDDVKATISDISDEFKETDGHPAMKDLVEMTASVAASSVELWMGVATNPDDAFHKLSGNGRKLQLESPDISLANAGATARLTLSLISNIIRSDVLGAVMYGVRPAISSVIEGDTSGLGRTVLAGVVTESVAAAFAIIGIPI